MAVNITIEVDYYRPVYLDGSSTVLLQSPVSPERQPSNEILVRQDQGQYKNEVTFKPAAQVNRLSSGSGSTYAHGVIIQSHADQGYRKGDRVWLTETACEDKNESIQDQKDIIAVNLRTWEPITVALDDVCWIPKFRKIDCGEDEEELLTISGPPVRKHDRKIYLLAIVQRLRVRNGITRIDKVEVREIVEQASFKYQNLTALPDGKRRTNDLFHRSLAAIAPAFFEAGLQGLIANPWSTGMPHTGRGPGQAISLATPPPEEEFSDDGSPNFSTSLPLTEGEEDPDVKRKMQELQRVVEAKKARKCKPLLPAGPPPADICNLGWQCPTPHTVFFQTNRPSLENLYPRHHHRPDHECPIGAAHSVHCVFRFLPGKDVADKRLCIIPATVKHHCCETNARPVNKTFRRRPDMIDGGRGSVQVTGGRGTISMVSGRDELVHCGVPVEVRSMPFVAERDLDELGRRLYGYEGKLRVVECESEVGHARDGSDSPDDRAGDGGGEDGARTCRLRAVPGLSREHQQIHEGRSCVLDGPSLGPCLARPSLPPAPGSAACRPILLREQEEDVFGDRHFYGDDDYDEEMEMDDG
ncbi:hypothetical protein J7T55_011613 [Diaporthe amygdali]|uniref:uncharacterized protein n=1 Tax=Phomopsis amygdali TaxID=1214568 RepID=UPI0022FED4C7|nr:uncharacterized protein J7T55_011613 [Diaporthe amygdali]KAJ0123149.1 hypothetical protein J7T55_011613 [Diaporthe amygdali]